MTWPTRNHPRICIAGLWKHSTEMLLQQEFSWQMGEWKTNMQSSDMVIPSSCRSFCSSLRVFGLHRKVHVVRLWRKKERNGEYQRKLSVDCSFSFILPGNIRQFWRQIPKLGGRDLALRENMFMHPLFFWGLCESGSSPSYKISLSALRDAIVQEMSWDNVSGQTGPCTTTDEVNFWFEWWGSDFRSVAKRA